MTERKFPGMDEFSSARIRRDVQRSHPQQGTEIGGSMLVNEIREIQGMDAVSIIDPDQAEAYDDLGALLHKRAQVQARLEHLKDFHSGMNAPEG